jgi:pimeloyl-ACP methyl ester carboxylesterase
MSATVSVEVTTPSGPRDVTLSYSREGRGEPLLLLHGVGHHWQAWEPVIPALAAERDVIAVDLPGFGASSALPDGLPHDLSSVNVVLSAVCEALGIERPHVAGNSLGGLLALELGRLGLVRSVTALSPAGFWSPAERVYAFAVLTMMRQLARRTPLPVIERMARPAFGRAMLMSAVYARPGRRSAEAVVAEARALGGAQGFDETLRSGRTVRFTDDVPGVPVTLAWGTKDRLLLPRQANRAMSVMPGARWVSSR